MNVINLDQDFQPYGGGIYNKQFKFPSGAEVHIQVPNAELSTIMITTRLKSSDDIMTLLLATDALRREGSKYISAFIPYFPYARQDRVMTKGEPLSVKVMADLINSQNYSKVYVYDPHSDVCMALLNNASVVSNVPFLQSVLGYYDPVYNKAHNDYCIVSPDAGSQKKIFKACEAIGYNEEVILCNKSRDVYTGKIKELTISTDDLKGRPTYILDDICSKGGTFKLLAQALKKKNAGKIYLVVSHYEGTAYYKELQDAGIEKVYKTNSMNDLESDFVANYKIIL